METEKIILGIDPGTIVMGYGVIQQLQCHQTLFVKQDLPPFGPHAYIQL